MTASERTEQDLLGSMSLPADGLYGIHTARARDNFQLTGQPVHPALVHAYGEVKLACAQVNRDLGFLTPADKAEALIRACREMARGDLDEAVALDGLQGGAGTSTHLAVNEVLANRALQILGDRPGNYQRISPLDDVNRHQSTNDTFPTALKLAALNQLQILEREVLGLQEAFQAKEKELAHVVKVGRTQLQDAVLTTLGRSMGAYAEAFNRDRWRISKCHERLRVVNLGGTAIGTGLAAPRPFIFQVTDRLRDNSGQNLARAENLLENTQNADVFVEVSGILKALAVSLIKISTDLRLLSSGPEAGLGEIKLPARQAGSSIMPGKINPVIPEAVTQAAMLYTGYDASLTQACAAGNLELNPFLPLVAHCLLRGSDLLANACTHLRRHCVEGLQADAERCARHVQGSTAAATALIAELGYQRVSDILKDIENTGQSLRDYVTSKRILDTDTFDRLISPEAVCRLGSPAAPKNRS
jgi:aspartate ammonia-lyase